MFHEEDGIPTLQGLEGVFSNIVSIAIGIAGVALFIMLIIGGFNYLTAGGEPPKMEAARKTLTYAIAGLILIALGFLILRLIEAFTGVKITEFRIIAPGAQ